MTQQLTIDWTRCDGHGICSSLLPELIQMDEWGYPLFRPHRLHADDVPYAKRAVAACPALALRLERSR